MKHIDFDALWSSSKQPIFLDEKVAKYLFKQNESVNFLPTLFDSPFPVKLSKSKVSIFKKEPKFTFSHSLVLSGKNQWHIVDNTRKGRGGFATVNESKYKIVVTHDAKKKHIKQNSFL